jgi:hypothetical protein
MKFRGRLIAEDNVALAHAREDVRDIQRLEVTISHESHDVVQRVIYTYTEEGTKRITIPMRRDRRDLCATVLISGNGQGNLYKHLQPDILAYLKAHRTQNPTHMGSAFIGLEMVFDVRIKKYTFIQEGTDIRVSGLKFVLVHLSMPTRAQAKYSY